MANTKGGAFALVRRLLKDKLGGTMPAVKMWGKLTLLLVCAAPAALGQRAVPLTGEQILDKNLKAIGGIHAWNHVRTFVLTETMKGPSPVGMFLGSGQPYSEDSGTVRVMYERPDKRWQQAMMAGFGQRFVACNGTVWWWTAEGSFHFDRSGKHPCEVPFPHLPWSDKYRKIEARGEKKVEGRLAFVVRLQPKHGSAITQYYDHTSFLLVRTVRAIDPDANVPGTIIDNYSDYRDVDGVKIPFKTTEQTVSPYTTHATTTVTVKQVEINVPITERTFEPPAD